jgi:hypothetical protein
LQQPHWPNDREPRDRDGTYWCPASIEMPVLVVSS